MTIVPVVLAGGSGTRLWPLSRRLFPKQFQSFTGGESLLQQTISRVSGDGFAEPLVICGEEHRFLVAEQLRTAGRKASDIILEPAGRGTAAAIATAALRVRQTWPDAGSLSILVLPSDHALPDTRAFGEALRRAESVERLTTFGVVPTHPATGFGYIRRGLPLAGQEDVFDVAAFEEKPDLATATAYLSSGDFLWNSGMFHLPVDLVLEELQRHEPGLIEACREALESSERDLDFLRLGAEAFKRANAPAFDVAVMERTDLGAVILLDAGWNDLGTWGALWEMSEKDAEGNAVYGDVVLVDSSESLVFSNGPLVAALGADNLTVVATEDAILVADRSRSEDVQKIVARLAQLGRPERETHLTVYRPWGSFRTLALGERFHVKSIVVEPKQQLSLQMHHHRAEHWIVVRGTAKVQRGEEELLLHENQSVYIPLGTRHRLENPGKIPLELIEVQSGAYLGEDDIVRFEDVYGRKPQKA